MAIIPEDITTVRVDQLPSEPATLTSLLPHQVGTELKQTTVEDFITLVATAIESGSGVGFLPVSVSDGQTLPAIPENPSFILVGSGTYINLDGFPDLVCTENLNALITVDTHWEISVEIPITPLTGSVQSVTGSAVDNADPLNPVVDLTPTPNLQEVLLVGNEAVDIPIRFSFEESGVSQTSELAFDHIGITSEEAGEQIFSDLNIERLTFNDTENTLVTEYRIDKIIHNEVDYPLPTGVSSPLATLDDLESGYIPLSGTTTGNEVTGIVEFKDPNGDITVRIMQGDGDEQAKFDIYGNAGVGINNFTTWGLGSFFGSQDNGATQYQFQLSSDKGISNNVDVSATIEDLDYTQKIYVDSQFGRLIPLTETEILALTPENGRLYYNTDINCPVFYDGTEWKKVSHSAM